MYEPVDGKVNVVEGVVVVCVYTAPAGEVKLHSYVSALSPLTYVAVIVLVCPAVPDPLEIRYTGVFPA